MSKKLSILRVLLSKLGIFVAILPEILTIYG